LGILDFGLIKGFRLILDFGLKEKENINHGMTRKVTGKEE